MNHKKLLSAIATTFVFLGSAGQANASLLTLQNPSSMTYQQTLNSPCVIGDPSCNNPAGFGSTTIDANTSSYDLFSPVYTVSQIRTLLGGLDTFFVGIDVNTTTSPLATERLNFFRLLVDNTVQFQYETSFGANNPNGGTQLVNANNGNGRSDELLTGFDLSSFAAGSLVRFEVGISNATDGREEFFLIGTNATPVPPGSIPEPGTTAILGLGLLGMGFVSLRNRKKQS